MYLQLKYTQDIGLQIQQDYHSVKTKLIQCVSKIRRFFTCSFKISAIFIDTHCI